MASKKISELDAKVPVVTDVLPVADPISGLAGKSDCASITYAGMNQNKVIPTSSSFAFNPTVVTISANTHNLGLGPSAFVRITSTGAYDLTGIVPLASAETNMGRMIRIVNVGSNAISIKNEDANSTASNRFLTAGGGNLNFQAGHMLECIYDGIASRWRVWMHS